MKSKKFSAGLCIIILLSVLICGCNGNDNNKGKVEILKIVRSPENPKPGDQITITVTTRNCTGCDFDYDSYFAGGSGGSQTMINLGDGKYKVQIGPFKNGTEVWCMIGAAGYGGVYVVSDTYTIQIGYIERSNITSLIISNIYQSPQNITSETTDLTVSAEVTSDVIINNVWFMYKCFKYGEQASGGGSMNYKSNNTYEEKMNIGLYDKGTKVFYKIVAQDESENTAVSSTFSFEI